jgi:hypothetical protein
MTAPLLQTLGAILYFISALDATAAPRRPPADPLDCDRVLIHNPQADDILGCRPGGAPPPQAEIA